MNKRLIGCVLGMFLVVVLQPVVAQSAGRAYFTTDKAAFLIGEPIQLVLHIRVPKDARLALPDFIHGLSPAMVENVGSMKLVQQFDDASVEYEWPVQVTLWRKGTYKILSMFVSYQLAGLDPITVTVETLQLEVSSVLADNDLSLRPLKPLVNLPYFSIGQILPITVIVLVATILLGRKLFAQWRKQTIRLDDTAIKGHPEAVNALKTLRQIEASNESPLAVYVQVSDCLRLYLARRYSIKALDLTTSELTVKLNEKTVWDDEYQQKLIEMLKRADLVKFARVIPKQGAAQQYTSVAAQWIQTVEQAYSGQP